MGDKAEPAARVADTPVAFDAFARRERPRLVAFAWILTGSLPAAEELAQEAVAAAWGVGSGRRVRQAGRLGPQGHRQPGLDAAS